jgi:hypothetical protein
MLPDSAPLDVIGVQQLIARLERRAEIHPSGYRGG